MDPGTIIAILEISSSLVKYLVEAGQTIKNAPEDLFRVIRETEKLRVLMDRLYVFQRGLPKDQQDILDKQVSTTECQALLKKLGEITSSVKPSKKHEDEESKFKFKDKWWWFRKKDDVEDLVKRIQHETDRISQRLVNEYLFKHSKDLSHNSEQMDKIMEMVLSITLKLNSEFLKTPQVDDNGIYSTYKAEGIAWYGQFRCKPRQDLNMPYFQDRFALADAVWAGDWKKMKLVLDYAERHHKQNWVNCTTIYKSTDTNAVPSGFRPLHQAAWHGSKATTEYLIQKGAWRLARTFRPTASSDADATPLDVARDHGWKDLYTDLNPVVRRPVSHKTLHILQGHLDSLIKKTFEHERGLHLECFLLPDLEVLTEYDQSRLWFPLHPELPDTRDGTAVHIILERNELVVVMRWGRTIKKHYRISKGGVQEIEQGVILH